MIDETGDSSADTTLSNTNSGLTTQSPASLTPAGLNRRKQMGLKRRQAALERFLAAPRDSQRKMVEDKWAQLCYELVDRAQRYSQGVGEKDFGKLSQLITAAAISKDKVFHREDQQQRQGNVVFQLFGNVGLDAIKRMLQPSTPVVVNPKESTKEIK